MEETIAKSGVNSALLGSTAHAFSSWHMGSEQWACEVYKSGARSFLSTFCLLHPSVQLGQIGQP